jgi:hypothetical protein
MDSSISWLAQWTSDILINTDMNQNVVLSVVSHVLDNCLDCTPLNNISKCPVDKLATTKYHPLSMKPSKTVFADNFEQAIKNLQKQEKSIGTMKNFQSLVSTNGTIVSCISHMLCLK